MRLATVPGGAAGLAELVPAGQTAAWFCHESCCVLLLNTMCSSPTQCSCLGCAHGLKHVATLGTPPRPRAGLSPGPCPPYMRLSPGRPLLGYSNDPCKSRQRCRKRWRGCAGEWRRSLSPSSLISTRHCFACMFSTLLHLEHSPIVSFFHAKYC